MREHIAGHSVFKGIAPQYLELLTQVAMAREFKAGDYLLREGDPANRFYLIIEGEVALESHNGGNTVIQTIGANEALGWSWLFPPFTWHLSARAVQSTKAIFFYATWLRENCDRDHEFGFEMMHRFVPVLIGRLQATRQQLAEARHAHTQQG